MLAYFNRKLKLTARITARKHPNYPEDPWSPSLYSRGAYEASWIGKEHEGILGTEKSEAETSRGAHGILEL